MTDRNGRRQSKDAGKMRNPEKSRSKSKSISRKHSANVLPIIEELPSKKKASDFGKISKPKFGMFNEADDELSEL